MFDGGWSRGTGAATSRAWSTEPPGPALATALVSTGPVDPVEDDGYDAVERLGAWEAIAAWAMAEQVDIAAGLLESRQARAGGSGVAQHDQFAATAMELATMARVAPATGEHRLHQAVCLTERLPQTLARLRAGRIAYSHARVVLEQTQDCTDTAATAVDARFWTGPGAETTERTPTQTRERVRRILQRLDPDALRRRVKAAQAGRSVRYWSDDDGATGVITLRLPADQARGVFAVIDAAAQRAADPPDTPLDQRRTLGNRRADATVDLIMTGATVGSAGTNGATGPVTPDAATTAEATDEATAEIEPAETPDGAEPPVSDVPDESAAADVPAERARAASGVGCSGSRADGPASRPGTVSRSGPQVQVRVLIPWQTLAGHSDHPAELEGHGPLPADLARRMAAGSDAVLQRLLLDPVTGTARHLDLRRYRPPPGLRHFVEDRDQFCHAPGCRRSARACDLDHVIAYDHTAPGGGDGRTHPDGLRPDCRRHHNLKTRRLWHCELVQEAGEAPAVRWTGPSGHRWIVRSPGLTEPDLTSLEHADDFLEQADVAVR